MLTFRQFIHENSASVRKRKSIAVLLGRAWFNLAKAGNARAGASGVQPSSAVPDLMVESQLGPRQETYGDTRLVLCRKAAC
jgi:hypothetical protein